MYLITYKVRKIWKNKENSRGEKTIVTFTIIQNFKYTEWKISKRNESLIFLNRQFECNSFIIYDTTHNNNKVIPITNQNFGKTLLLRWKKKLQQNENWTKLTLKGIPIVIIIPIWKPRTIVFKIGTNVRYKIHKHKT